MPEADGTIGLEEFFASIPKKPIKKNSSAGNSPAAPAWSDPNPETCTGVQLIMHRVTCACGTVYQIPNAHSLVEFTSRRGSKRLSLPGPNGVPNGLPVSIQYRDSTSTHCPTCIEIEVN